MKNRLTKEIEVDGGKKETDEPEEEDVTTNPMASRTRRTCPNKLQ